MQLLAPAEGRQVALVPLARLGAELVCEVEGTDTPALRVGGDAGLRIVPESGVLVDLLLDVADGDDAASILVLVTLLLHLTVVGQLALVGVQIHVRFGDGSLLLDQLWLRGLPLRSIEGRL